jgi:hypothetical protein
VVAEYLGLPPPVYCALKVRKAILISDMLLFSTMFTCWLSIDFESTMFPRLLLFLSLDGICGVSKLSKVGKPLLAFWHYGITFTSLHNQLFWRRLQE